MRMTGLRHSRRLDELDDDERLRRPRRLDLASGKAPLPAAAVVHSPAAAP